VTEKAPRVSVIVPNYNHARFLRRRLESVFGQTFQNYEVIFLDDASTDNSLEIARDVAREHPMQIIASESNSGNPFKQWNKGVAAARGELIWIAESDDDSEPQFLECQVAILDANPRVGLAYCQSNHIDENGKSHGTCEKWTADIDPTRWKGDYVSSGITECATALVIKNTIPNASAVVFRRDVFERAGRAPENLRLCGDWMTWINLLLISDVAFTAAPLNHFRFHQGSVRSATKTSQSCIEEYAVKLHAIRNVAVTPAVRRRAAADALQKWGWSLYDPAFRGNWSLHLRIARHAYDLGQLRVLRMLPMYLRCGLSLSPVGWFYRFIRDSIKRRTACGPGNK
jgi:glycosyltransferase involved in cell wall biosynthesis